MSSAGQLSSFIYKHEISLSCSVNGKNYDIGFYLYSTTNSVFNRAKLNTLFNSGVFFHAEIRAASSNTTTSLGSGTIYSFTNPTEIYISLYESSPIIWDDVLLFSGSIPSSGVTIDDTVTQM